MTIAQRIARLREQLVAVGERPAVKADRHSVMDHTDFSDFSEKSGPGDKGPNFTDFVDKA